MEKSLYERLGGHEGITAIVAELLAAHLRNPIIKTRFEAIEDLEHAKAMAVAFFCAGSGGPEPYEGRSMLEAHRHMNISEQELVAVLDDALYALDQNGIDQATKNEVLGIMYSLKAEIVRV